jgi:hypothetical protein
MECATVESPGGGAGGLAAHQHQRAFVRIAQPRLHPHHGLAETGEAEMAWLDDARMDRTDRHLVQVAALGSALDRQEFGWLGRRPGRARAQAHRHAVRPAAVIEPGPRVDAVLGRVAPQVGDHALEPCRTGPGGRQCGVAALDHRAGSDEHLLFGRIGEQGVDVGGVGP